MKVYIVRMWPKDGFATFSKIEGVFRTMAAAEQRLAHCRSNPHAGYNYDIKIYLLDE